MLCGLRGLTSGLTTSSGPLPSKSEEEVRDLPSFRLKSFLDDTFSKFSKSRLPFNFPGDREITDLENLVDREKFARQCGSCLEKVGVVALLLGYVILRYFQSQTTQSTPTSSPSNSGTALDLAVGATFVDLARQHASRVLLQSSTLTSVFNVSMTELVYSSYTFKPWDLYGAQQGRLIVSTPSDLIPGVSFEQSPAEVLKTVTYPSMSGFATKGNACFVSGPTTNTTTIFDVTSTSNPKISRVLNTGTPIIDMEIIGDSLFASGVNMIMQIYNISKPFNPVVLGQIPASINGNAIERMEKSSLWGCASSNGFYVVDTSNLENPIVTGSVPGLVGLSVASSEGFFYVATSNGLAIVNATNSTAPFQSSFFPATAVGSVCYENGICYLGTNSGLIVIDVQDPLNPTIVTSVPVIGGSRRLLCADNYIYATSTQPGICVFDKTNPTNPVLAVRGLLPETGITSRLGIIGNDFLALGGINLLSFVKKDDECILSGVAAAGSKRDEPYSLSLTAATLSGGVVVDNTKSMALTVRPAVTSTSRISNVICAVGKICNAILNPNAFLDVKGLPLTLTLQCEAGSTLTDKMTLNPISGELSGTPEITNLGTTICKVKAVDSYDASGMSSPFNVTVFYGPTLAPIENKAVIIDEQFSLDITATSKDPSSTFTYAVSGQPSSFTCVNGILSGVPDSSNLGTYNIVVTATDQNGLTDSKSFVINVVQPGVPVFINPLSSYTILVGNDFFIPIPVNAAVDPSNAKANITYSAQLANSKPLPSFIKCDGKACYGTAPSADLFENDVVYSIKITATETFTNGRTATSSAIFNLTISGTPLYRTAMAVGGPIVGIGTVALATRVALYNCCVRSPRFISCLDRIKKVFCCASSKFIEEKGVIYPYQSFEYAFKTESAITSCKTLLNGKPFPGGEPHWLKADINSSGSLKLKAVFVPNLGPLARTITVTAMDEKGYNLEKLVLKVVASSNFSRPCLFPSEQIKEVQIFSGRYKPRACSPSWIRYDRELNAIIAAGSPPIESIEPLTILIIGYKDEVLETIYINKQPEEPLLIAAVPASDEKAHLLSATTPSSAPSTPSGTSISVLTPSTPSGSSLGGAVELTILGENKKNTHRPLINSNDE